VLVDVEQAERKNEGYLAEKINWHNETRRIRDIVPYVANPRQITDKQAKDLKASLAKFGLADPLIINTNNELIGGHQRKKILESLMGVAPDYEIDVRVPDRELSDKEVEELNIRLNKNTGQWDFDVLANEFELPDLIEWGFEADRLLQDKFTYRMSEYSVARKPEALSLTGLFGCYSACRWDKNKSNDYEEFLGWKSNPSESRRKTAEMAADLSRVIDLWARGWRGFVITAPPQGVSFGGEYPAGILAKEVSNILGVDYVTMFKEWGDGHKSHHPYQSLLRVDPPKVIVVPELPVLIVDDAVTSGNTAKLSLEALSPHPCWFFAWISNAHKPKIKTEELSN